MDFKIYYGDGSVYSGSPEDAPALDVQCIAWNDPNRGIHDLGRVVMSQWDIYIYSDHVGGWHGTNKYSDLLMHLGHGCGPGGVRAVLQGAWINREDYFAIQNRAETDPGLRRKSATYPILEDGSE